MRKGRDKAGSHDDVYFLPLAANFNSLNAM
jgi:hypothetical protein